MLLEFFQVVADEDRLRIIGLLSSQSYSASEMATALNLKEGSVVHHLNKLRELGLVNLRTQNNGYRYILNTDALNHMKRTVATENEDGEDDTTWIDALNFEEWEAKVLQGCTQHQRLRHIPEKHKKFKVVMRWLATYFEANRRYTEAEVNEIIEQVNPDFATLRRGLVDYGYLERKRDGTLYWMAEHA